MFREQLATDAWSARAALIFSQIRKWVQGRTVTVVCVEAGGGLAGNICSSRPWKMLPSSAANAASASLGSMNCTRAMPLDLRVALQHTCMFHGPATTTKVQIIGVE